MAGMLSESTSPKCSPGHRATKGSRNGGADGDGVCVCVCVGPVQAGWRDGGMATRPVAGANHVDRLRAQVLLERLACSEAGFGIHSIASAAAEAWADSSRPPAHLLCCPPADHRRCKSCRAHPFPLEHVGRAIGATGTARPTMVVAGPGGLCHAISGGIGVTYSVRVARR